MTEDPTKKHNQQTGSGQQGQQSGREKDPTQKNDLGNDDTASRKTPRQGSRDLETDTEDEQDNQTRQRKAS